MPAPHTPRPILVNQYQAAVQLDMSTRTFRDWCNRLGIVPVHRAHGPKRECLYSLEQVRTIEEVLEGRRRRGEALQHALPLLPEPQGQDAPQVGEAPAQPPRPGAATAEDLVDILYLAARATLREWRRGGDNEGRPSAR